MNTFSSSSSSSMHAAGSCLFFSTGSCQEVLHQRLQACGAIMPDMNAFIFSIFCGPNNALTRSLAGGCSQTLRFAGMLHREVCAVLSEILFGNLESFDAGKHSACVRGGLALLTLLKKVSSDEKCQHDSILLHLLC